MVERVLTRAGKTELLLVVDQFEEVFSGDGDGELIGVVLSALHARRDVAPRSLTVVVTLRADFLGQALEVPALAAALEGAVTTIGQMGRDQLRAVIEGPLPKAVTYEAGLVERILGDVGEEPGSLPLLEFALTLLWERQDRGRLTHAAYGQLGGVGGALASYAERVYVDELLPDDRDETRHLLIQLVRPSEVGAPVRRRARRPELGEPRWQLGQRLAATRLLVADRDPTGVESVELVHEALIGGWSRLSEWCAADRAFRTWQERLRGSVAQWETVRRNEGALLRGAPLAEAERWLTERPDDLGAPERQFIQVSRALRDRSVRRLRVVAAVLALLFLVSSTLGGVALWQFNRADENRKLAQSRALVTQANSLISSQPDVAMRLAATAYKIKDTQEAIDTLTAMASQRQHVDRLLATGMGGDTEIAFNPTDSTMVALTNSNGIELWDIDRNSLHSRHDADGVGSSTFSPDGRTLAYTQSTEQEEKVVLWSHVEGQEEKVDLSSHAESRVRKMPLNFASDEFLEKLTFSSDGELLGACAGQQILLWSLKSASFRHSIPLTQDTPCAFGFTDASHELAYVDGDDIIIRNIVTGAVVARDQPGPPSSANGKFFFDDDSNFTVAPDGRSAIYQGQIHQEDDRDGKVRYSRAWWDFDRRKAQKVELFDGENFYASFASDSDRVAIFQSDNVVLFDAAQRKPIAVYPRVGNFEGALSPDGDIIVMIDEGISNAISRIDTRSHRGIPIMADRVAIQPDNEHLTAVSSGKVAIYSVGNPEPIIVWNPTGDRSSGRRIEDLSPDGLHYAFTDTRAQKASLLDVSLLAPASEVPLEGNSSDVLRLSFDPRGECLVGAGESEITVWSTKTGGKVSRISLPPDYTTIELAVSPGGRYVAATSLNGGVRLWDTDYPDHVGADLPFNDASSISFSPDGTRLSIGGQNEIKLWILDAKKFDDRRIPVDSSLVKFSPDGSRLATRETGSDQISVWRLDMRELLLEGTVSEGAASRKSDFAFTFDNSQLVVGRSGVHVVPFGASWALQHICRIIDGDLTPGEWNKYLPESEYAATCPS